MAVCPLRRRSHRRAPVLVREDLVKAGSASGVGRFGAEVVAKRVTAEEDPIVLVVTVESVLQLVDRSEDGRKIGLVDQRDKSCAESNVARRRREGERVDALGGQVKENREPSPNAELEVGRDERELHAGSSNNVASVVQWKLRVE